MPRGNPAIKLAVTVDAEVHAKVLDAAEAEGKSVSAWITDAARRALLVRDGLAAVAEWEAEHGALTPAELESARSRIERSSLSVALPDTYRGPRTSPTSGVRRLWALGGAWNRGMAQSVHPVHFALADCGVRAI